MEKEERKTKANISLQQKQYLVIVSEVSSCLPFHQTVLGQQNKHVSNELGQSDWLRFEQFYLKIIYYVRHILA